MDYYNKTRGPLAVTLQRGGSISIGPKTWCYIAPEDEGTPSLAASVRKGFLVRALVPITDLSTPTPVVAPAPEVVLEAVAAPAASDPVLSSVAADPVLVPAPAQDLSSVVEPKSSRRNK